MSKFNRVWSKFSRKTNYGNVLNFRMEEVSSDRVEDVVQLCVNYFATEETFHKAAGIPKSVEALEESRELLRNLLKQKPHHIVICCLDDEKDKAKKFIGASLMVQITKEVTFEEFKPRTQEMKKMCEIIGSIFTRYDALEEIQLECFYDDRGVVVHPNYRGLGIAKEFFRVRRMICKEHEVPMTGAWMTSHGSQKAAECDGWETVREICYKDLGRQFGVTFEDAPLMCKFMIAKI